MKLIIKTLLGLLFTIGCNANIESDPNEIINELYVQIKALNANYNVKYTFINNQINEINNSLIDNISIEKKVELLILKDQLKTKIQQLSNDNYIDISKIRYIKGLQIIKLLYEKVLSLDHHFATVRTFSEISKISNPNQYPEFSRINELIKLKMEKKSGFDLTSLLGTNTIVSVVNTFSNLMVSSLNKSEKDTELTKIECVLDFTLRMQNDLNTIYYETAYLQTSNETVKHDIEILFKDYTKPLNYTTSLEVCRNEDEWDNVNKKLNLYIDELIKSENVKKNRMQIDLEFPIDRLIQYITQYNNFINDGEKFYRKFNVILNSYENEKQCESKLPLEFKRLKTDIDVAIDKFKVAYKPVEINGSKMKEILYGIHEFQ